MSKVITFRMKEVLYDKLLWLMQKTGFDKSRTIREAIRLFYSKEKQGTKEDT